MNYDVIFSKIHPVLNWKEKENVAMALVELKHVVERIADVVMIYKEKCGTEVASGAGLVSDLVKLFSVKFIDCIPDVNKLNEDFHLTYIIDKLTEGQKHLSEFLSQNIPSLRKSALRNSTISKLVNVVVKLEKAIGILLVRINEIVSYRHQFSSSGRRPLPM